MERYIRRVDDRAAVSRVESMSPVEESRNGLVDGLVAAGALIEIAKDGPAVVSDYMAKAKALVAPAQGAHRKTDPGDGGASP
jgi:hypothetical protein